MLRTNRDNLVKMAVAGAIAPPTMARGPHRFKANGEPFVPIGMAGIVYNARPGCPAFGWEADHLEPAVCVHAQDAQEDYALHGDVAAEIRAPFDGIPFGMRTNPTVQMGDWCVFYGVIEEELTA